MDIQGTKGTSRRVRILTAVCALALAVVVAGVATAMAGRQSPAPKAKAAAVVIDTPVVTVAPVASPTESPAAPTPATTPAPPVAVDPMALADGTYPAWVRKVDVPGARIRIDVIQVFKGRSAFKAAIQDGMTHHEARYHAIYIRNENDLLRFVPVARDVRIRFLGSCESPSSRSAALEMLQKATTPFSKTYYYTVEVADGQIHLIGQHLAISAC